MNKIIWPRLLPLVILVAECMIACKDDDKPKLIPEVTTAAVTEITSTTAMGGGEITSDGNDQITVSGICWSSTNTTPTTSDGKSELTISEGSFTSKIENLPSGSSIFVRAYATNRLGTGYGDTKTFMTDNAAPVAANIVITGTAEVNKTLIGSYTYTDSEGNAESGTILQWYRANDGSGTGEVAIAGATTSSYVLQDVDEFKYLRIGVTPKSSVGSMTGLEVKSNFIGPIAVRTTLTFSYNGANVTYGIITSSVTGKKWLDRNLGAPSMPTSSTDFINHGDLFQWGRGPDGHQLMIRNGESKSIAAVNGISTTLSDADVPGNSMFIQPSSAFPRDWRSPQNSSLWNGPNGINNPCPSGWHVPSESEWDAEKMNALAGAYAQLKITNPGFYDRPRLGTFTNASLYWSSSTSNNPDVTTSTVYYFQSTPSDAGAKTDDFRAAAHACRCIKN